MAPACCVVGPRGCQRRPGVHVNNKSKETRRAIISNSNSRPRSDLLSPFRRRRPHSGVEGSGIYPWIDLLIGIFTWLGLFAFTGAMLAGVIG